MKKYCSFCRKKEVRKNILCLDCLKKEIEEGFNL